MPNNAVVLHSALTPGVIENALLRSIDVEVVPRSALPWFIRLFWKGGSRRFRGVVDGNTFRLKRGNARDWSPNFYGRWEAENSGTRIEGYFDLDPLVRKAFRFTLAVALVTAVIGILLNLVELTAGTHFTTHPRLGLVLSTLAVPYCLGLYVVAQKLGSRRDDNLLAFLERTIAGPTGPTTC